MAVNPPNPGPPSAPKSVGLAAVVIVVVVVAAIVIVAAIAVDHYSKAADAVALVAAVVGPLAGVGAAAFGIQLSSDAKAETTKTKQGVAKVADQISQQRSSPAVRDAGGDAGLLAIETELRRLAY